MSRRHQEMWHLDLADCRVILLQGVNSRSHQNIDEDPQTTPLCGPPMFVLEQEGSWRNKNRSGFFLLKRNRIHFFSPSFPFWGYILDWDWISWKCRHALPLLNVIRHSTSILEYFGYSHQRSLSLRPWTADDKVVLIALTTCIAGFDLWPWVYQQCKICLPVGGQFW